LIRINIHILLFILILAQNSLAQVLSRNNRFQADYAAGCAPLTVNVADLSGSISTIQYNFDYINSNGENGFGFTNETDTTYTSPGQYLIIQIIQVTTGPNLVDSLYIDVYPPDPPEFIIKPCVGHQATVEIDPLFYDSISIAYTPTDVFKIGANDTPPIYTYSSGLRDITVRGFVNEGLDNCGQSTRAFQTINNISAGIIQNVAVLSSDDNIGEIQVDFSLQSNVLYQLEIAEDNNSTFEFLSYVKFPDNSVLIDTLNTSENIYCFRLVAVNDCDPTLNIPSEIVCSADLAVESQNNQNVISWNTSVTSLKFYQLFRDNILVATINDPNQTSYIDTDVECNQEYCYNLEVYYNSGAESYSETECITATIQYTPENIEDVTVSIVDNGIEAFWEAPNDVDDPIYEVHRSLNGAPYTLTGTIDTTLFLDLVSIDTTSIYCYQIAYEDACGNLSDFSLPACPIYLYLAKNPDGSFYLTWLPYSGWAAGVDYYIVEKLDEAGNVLESTDVGINNIFQITNQETQIQVTFYRIVGVSFFGAETYSNQVKVLNESHIFFPSAFTPDGDGLNDEFMPQSLFVAEYELRIFNRWGEMIFYTDSLDHGWDGSLNGMALPQGNYTYSANVFDNLGNDLSTSGTIFLIRKTR